MFTVVLWFANPAFPRLSHRDSIFVVFSFSSSASFEDARRLISQLRSRTLSDRPVVALVATHAGAEVREVDEVEVEELKREFTMFYWEVEREDDAFPVLNAIASVQISGLVQTQEVEASEGLGKTILSAIRSFAQFMGLY